MKYHPQMTAPFLGLTVLSSLAFALTVVLTRYPGRIDLGVEMGGGRGHIVIDGRISDHPALPPAKQPTSSSPAPGDRTLGK